MFQTLRQNSPLYILYKGENPRIEVGHVMNNPHPKPKYTFPQTFGQQAEMVVDISVCIGDQTLNLNSLPVMMNVSDSYSNGEGIVVADSREAMCAELMSLKQKSDNILNSVDYHKNFIAACDKMLGELNPEFAERKTQSEEIGSLKKQVADMAEELSVLVKHLLQKEKNNVNVGD